MVVLTYDEGKRKTIHFGDSRYSDYTLHKDSKRKQRYVVRHAAREDWTKCGVLTAGFWSKHILWNKPTIKASLLDVKCSFQLKSSKP